MDLNTTQDVLEYLKRRPHVVVLSTCSSDGQPAGSPVYYAVSDEGTIIVSSEIQTRKWRNLKQNPRAALVFGVSSDQPSILGEGPAELLQRGTEFERLGQHYFSVVPEAKKFSEGTMGLIKITPERFRVTTHVAGTGPTTREIP